ncbi:hypothetical protein Tco_1543168 [Tanacetum coccineum]
MECFKTESMHVNGAPECMHISGFMHGITNPDLIKRLNDNIPKTVDEMMSLTTAFLRGEVAVANQSRKKGLLTWKQNETGRRFTPLIKMLKEILEIEAVKFKAPPPMTGPAETRNKNKFCEFYRDKGQNMDDCLHLRKQIEEAVKSGQLSHLIKELKQGPNKGEHAKTTIKRKASNKDKVAPIFMVQLWKRIIKQRVTQIFSPN